MKTPLSALLLLLLLTSFVLAQSSRPDPERAVGGNMKVPSDWKVALDHHSKDIEISSNAETADVFFVNMTPGWHITSRPSALFWHPGSDATDLYRAEVGIHVFAEGTGHGGVGMFVGGQNPGSEDTIWDAFLIRQSGEFSIVGRYAGVDETIVEWTEAPSIKTAEDAAGEASVYNLLAVETDTDTVSFEINGYRVASLPRGEVNSDGLLGIRVEPMSNIHVSEIQVFPKRLAPE